MKKFKIIMICILTLGILIGCSGSNKTEEDYIEMWDNLEEKGIGVKSTCSEGDTCDISSHVNFRINDSGIVYNLSYAFDQRTSEAKIIKTIFYMKDIGANEWLGTMNIIDDKITDDNGNAIADDNNIEEYYKSYLESTGYSEDELKDFAAWLAIIHPETD